MSDLAEQILEAGLVQFGLFGDDPIRVNLQLLPSYPVLLQNVSRLCAERIDASRYERLLCGPESIPLGVALSMATGIPLVYSRGSVESPVHDLMGAYDVGHPTLWVANAWQGDGNASQRIAGARRVGLEINGAFVLIDYGIQHADDIEVEALIALETLTGTLASIGRLPEAQAAAVREWLQQRKAVNAIDPLP